MSYVEAAGADPTVCASRAQTPVNVVASRADSTSQSAEEFASVFALTRQSLAWLNGLLSRRADQIAASQRRQQRVNDALSTRSRNEKSARTVDREPDASATRVDRLRASVRDDTQTVGRTPSARGDHQDAADAGRADSRAAGEVESAPTPRSQQIELEALEHPQGPEPETNELTTQQQANQSVEQETATTAGSVHADVVEGADRAGLSSSSPGANGQVPVVPLNAQGPAALTVQTQVGESVTSVQVAMTAAAARGGETGTGVSQDSLQASTTARTAECQARPGGVTLDFQNILTHVGKGQATGPTSGGGLVTAGGKGVIGGTVQLAGSESVEQLVRVVRSNLVGRHASMVLRLEPPELGQLRVDVRMHDQVLLLRFQTETQAGHDALQTRLADLRTALEQQGIQLDRVEVEFRPPAAPGSEGSETDERQYHQNAPGGGDSFFGHARGQDGSASGSFDSGRFPSPPEETQPEPASVGNFEPADDDVARPAETGVDLIV